MIEKANISQFSKLKTRSCEETDRTAKALYHLEDKINEIIDELNKTDSRKCE